MAEAAKAVSDYFEENNKKIAYVIVANAISVDCDCDAHQGDPVIKDIGIFASLDPVANDQAFLPGGFCMWSIKILRQIFWDPFRTVLRRGHRLSQ